MVSNKLQQLQETEQRYDWQVKEVLQLFDIPFNDLLYRAQTIHRQHFDPNDVQVSTLLSIKTGGCPEDCSYCPQSRRYQTFVEEQPLMALKEVLTAAKAAKAKGATRFCMGAAWRSPKDRDLPVLTEMISQVKAQGLETCMTLGMLTDQQAQQLGDAGLDYYNHNLDTSEEFYGEIISTRTYQHRLDTLKQVRNAGMKVCCGGIVGMGESRNDRAALLSTLASLDPYPESVPINMLVRVEGTPLAQQEHLEPLEFVRCIAVARIVMPTTRVRLSAGREKMTETLQALAFFAGANSIFYGDQLLTTTNPAMDADREMFNRLGLNTAESEHSPMSLSTD